MNRRRHPLLYATPPFLKVLGTLLSLTASAMVLPVVCAALYEEADLWPLAGTALGLGAVGGPLMWVFRGDRELGPRGAFLLATLGWAFISAVSTIPFMIHGSIPSFADAFFEMISGCTTTGATILTDIEALPHGLLLWRSVTHLLGGMGFITLAVILLPNALSGLRLFRAESSPGQVITRERFTPRTRDAVVYLWWIYLGLNAIQIVLLLLGGMSLFDSLCHTFGTVATAGFSPYNASMGHYDNAYFDWVTIIFMFLGGCTFVLFFYLLKGNWRLVAKNTELRWYFGIVLAFCGAVSAILWLDGRYGLADAIRHGTFQVVSLLTTTGFTTTDYELWPHSAQMFLYVVCFVGACAGSTTSGIKIVHYVVIYKFMVAAVKKIFFQPLAVVSVRLNGERVDQMVVNLAFCFFVVNVFMVLMGACVMSMLEGMDMQSSMSTVISSLMNIGPGFGDVGPSHTYAGISAAGKYFLSFNMLVGRLELFSALVLFYPSFWRR
jgi:trk system potassium uptake protein TrkH